MTTHTDLIARLRIFGNEGFPVALEAADALANLGDAFGPGSTSPEAPAIPIAGLAPIIEKLAREACQQVADSYRMGGLADGLYADFAVDVSALVAQAVAKRCAELCRHELALSAEIEFDVGATCLSAIEREFGIEGSAREEGL